MPSAAVGVGFDNPNYLGGEQPARDPLAPEGMTDYYRRQGGMNPYKPHGDTYMLGWGNQANQNQQADRATLQQVYGHLQGIAQGGMTPQQAQQLQGFQMARQNQQQAALSQPGGAYARSAGLAALNQGAGIQGMQQVQQAGQLRAADMMAAQNQMQQVAAQQRAMDLQNQGMTAEQAQRQAELEAKARGMNYQQQMGYGDLELGGMRSNLASYVDSIRRGYTKANQDQQKSNAEINAGLQAGMSATTGVLGML